MLGKVIFTVAITTLAWALAGCNVPTGVAATESIIPKSVDRDFGFAGSWVLLPSAEPNRKDFGETRVTIEKGDSYLLQASNAKVQAPLNFEFRAAEISAKLPYAIIEIEQRLGESMIHRRLGIAAVEDEKLYVWLLNGKRLGELLYEDGHGAVIEHHSLWTEVRCKPDHLLKTLREHSGQLIGKSPFVLQRANPAAK